MNVVIGLDTSCYTTSVAALDEGGRVLASCRKLLPVPSGERGLRQSEAVFVHVRQLPQVMEELAPVLRRENARICAVAVSNAPREGEDSYMPVFLAGSGHARTLAAALGVPCYFFSHQQGHVAAGQIEHLKAWDARFTVLHISGGTTDLLLSQEGQLTPVGGSLDLHAGQMVDRIGVAMGFGFPAGAALEQLAMTCQESVRGLLPVSMARGDLQCHLSGAESQCIRWLKAAAYPSELIAMETFDFLARTVARLLAAGCAKSQTRQALVVGGVAASSLLREKVESRLKKAKSSIQVIFGRPEYSADNAAGIALLGVQRHFKDR